MNTISEFLKSYCETGRGIEGLSSCIQGIYNLLVALAVLVAFLIFLYGAILYMLSPIPDVKGSGKGKMIGALKGLAIIFIFGAILYWINPNIFNAKLIFYRVVELKPPEEEIGLYGKVIPAEAARALKAGEERTFDKVILTHYYTPKEHEEGGNFVKEVKIEGSGKCEGGNYCNCNWCRGYNGYINYNGNKIDAPRDACGCKAIPAKTFAVPPEWFPSSIEVYYRDKLLYSGYGTDRGSAIVGQHIDLYTGEGKKAFKSFPDIDYVKVKVKKLNKCTCPKYEL